MQDTSVSIEFPYNSAFQNIPFNGAKVRRAEFEHEILILSIINQTGFTVGLRTNDPVQAALKGPFQTPLHFYGYVHEVSEDLSPNPQSHTHEITCVGATYRMKNSRQKVWTDVTLSDIAKELCREYNLTADVEDTTLRIPQVVQAGESDWSFLCRMAKRYGQVVYPTGTTLHVHSRLRNARDRYISAPLMRFAGEKKNHSGDPREVRTFVSKVSDYNQGDGTPKSDNQNSGLDINTGESFRNQVYGVSNSSVRNTFSQALFTTQDTSSVPAGYQDSIARLEGNKQMSLWTYRAESTLNGRPEIAPTAFLYLEGLQNNMDGYWHVISVWHYFTNRNDYWMTAEIGTDSLGKPVSNYSPPANTEFSPRVGDQRQRVGSSVLKRPGGQTQLEFLNTRGGRSQFAWAGSIDSIAPLPEEVRPPPFVVERLRRASR